MAHRIERVNSLIRQEISELLQRQVKDPRLGNFIAVTEVCTSPDMKFTQVFVSHIGSEEEKKETLKALGAAAGFFRRELSQRLKLRYIPEISFHWDDSIERGERILQLIDGINAEKTSPT
ncbi:MAG: ribosome-binding factor [Dehalococcoidales bacterium]|nr:ribosome-binding factor [Dehalococcoidales bacterium]